MKRTVFSIAALCVIAFAGCSKLKDETAIQASNRVSVHPAGMTTPSSPDFHGKLLAANNWDMSSCVECHGADFKGGSSGVSCQTCHLVHSKGLASHSSPNFHVTLIKANNWNTGQCATCHGADFKGGATGKSCVTCHFVHTPGSANPTAANFHGKAIAASNYDMKACTFCHGADYKGGISGAACTKCHTKTNGPEYCATCHGSDTNPAPPKDLAGNTAVTAHAVGQHQLHLGVGGLGAAVKCAECHNVPSSFYAAGHLDNTQFAEVRYDTSSVAKTMTNRAGTTFFTASMPTITPAPSYTQASGKCAGTYCHGNFKNVNPTNTIAWTDTTAASVACGTCHGDVTKTSLADRALPKTVLNGGIHPTDTRCYGCHAGIIDANMKLLDPSKHMNGKLNVYGTEQNF